MNTQFEKKNQQQGKSFKNTSIPKNLKKSNH